MPLWQILPFISCIVHPYQAEAQRPRKHCLIQAPGKIIKPEPQGTSKRGRPRTKEVYDDESESDDDAGNVIDNLCDYVTDIERKAPSELKKLCTSSDFYITYANHKETEPKYNEEEDLYEDTCDHILCEFLVEINRRELDPSLFDELFMFMVLFTRCLNDHGDQPTPEAPAETVEFIKSNHVKDIVDFVNPFLLDYLLKYINEYGLQSKEFFQVKHIMKVIEYLFNWLLMKKYTGHKLIRNDQYRLE